MDWKVGRIVSFTIEIKRKEEVVSRSKQQSRPSVMCSGFELAGIKEQWPKIGGRCAADRRELPHAMAPTWESSCLGYFPEPAQVHCGPLLPFPGVYAEVDSLVLS